jgi:hypothetical protein
MYIKNYKLPDFNVRNEPVQDNTSEFNTPEYGTSIYSATDLPCYDVSDVAYYDEVY